MDAGAGEIVGDPDAGVSGDDLGSDAEADGPTEQPAPACAQCSIYGSPQALGIPPSVIGELSGLAASRTHPGVLYTHNDSGDSARIFALTESAQLAAEIHLTGATATDWEDIQVGACPGGSCVYIGDTGDNKLDRNQYVIYRIAEPEILPTNGGVVSVSYEQFPFVYPDGRHNTETLLVHPITGQVFVIIKETGIPATVYEMPLPLAADQQVTLTMVGALAITPASGVVTDGSFHPCGDRLLVRTTGEGSSGLHELSRSPGESMLALFTAKPVAVPVAIEPQGEAVTYAQDGVRYFTASEVVSGTPATPLSVVGCAAP
jgi:hypothetical protein